jgi:hypothetical protein
MERGKGGRGPAPTDAFTSGRQRWYDCAAVTVAPAGIGTIRAFLLALPSPYVRAAAGQPTVGRGAFKTG